MSASYRSLARLPLSVFTNLGEKDDPQKLRSIICAKLRNFGHHRGGGGGSGSNVTTVGQLLQMSKPAILRAVSPSLTAEECEELTRRICAACAPTATTALQLLRQTLEYSSLVVSHDGASGVSSDAEGKENALDRMRHLPSGMKTLDDCLRGGFRIGTITELVGRAGVGKTQISLQLCVMAAKYSQGSVYIDTEKKLSLHRLKEIASERAAALNDDDLVSESLVLDDGNFLYSNNEEKISANSSSSHHPHPPQHEKNSLSDNLFYRSPREVLENVTVHAPLSTEEMLSVVGGLEEEILLRNEQSTAAGCHSSSGACSTTSTFPVRLVILDSIAAPARRDFGLDSAPQRVSAIFQTAQMLKRLADQLQVAVVVVNQVGLLDDGFIDQRQGPGQSNAPTRETGGSDYVAVSAALGTSWHHCVTTRLLLEHERDPHRQDTNIDMVHEAAAMGKGHGANQPAWMTERGHIRTATVLKSNVTGPTSMNYEVTAMGVCQVE